MVLAAMMDQAHHIRNNRGVYFIDEIAALMALVRGRSNSPSLDAMVQFVQLSNFAMKVTPFYEYVESKSNRSDEISQEGLRGKWAQDEQFELGVGTFVYQLLELPVAALLRIFACF